MFDRRATHLDVRVYETMGARDFTSDLVSVSADWIVAHIPASKRSVVESINHLIKLGHVEQVAPRRGRRPALYRLTSPVYGSRQKVDVATGPKIHETVTRPETDTVRRRLCVRCGKLRKCLTAHAICAKCMAAWTEKTAVR